MKVVSIAGLVVAVAILLSLILAAAAVAALLPLI